MKRKTIMTVLALMLMFTLIGCNQKDEAIIRTTEWEDQYPEVYQSYLDNSEMEETTYGGSVPIDYLETYPNLKVYYDGYGFSKEYFRARGHTYALEDAINTQRPKPGASCLACKTADFVVALEKDGVGVNSIDFDEFVQTHEANGMETISCYDCHKNQPGEINVARPHILNAVEDYDLDIEPEMLSCAQCHVEYYLDPETVEVILPWKYGLDTDDMLQYYDEIDFADWVHPETDTPLLKAQHPEFETYHDSIHAEAGLSCIDCHMPVVGEGEDSYRSHHWTSPLKSEETLRNTCLKCHADNEPEDIIAWVEEIQGEVFDLREEVSSELVEFIQVLAEHKDQVSDDDLALLHQLHRHAQFKWDFVFVENGEGFHNKEKAIQNLEESRTLIREGMEILEQYR